MPWFYVQFITCNTLQVLCNNRRLFNVAESIHEAKMLQPCIFSITLKSLQLLHKNCITLHALKLNCTRNHGIAKSDTDVVWFTSGDVVDSVGHWRGTAATVSLSVAAVSD